MPLPSGTRHGLYGGPRPAYASFSGKTVTILVVGPVCWAKAEVYIPGVQEGELFFPSAQDGGVYLPGSKEGERIC